MPRHRSALHWAVLALPVLLIALMLGTALGETRIPFDVVLKVLANKLFGAGYAVDRIDTGIVWNYRLTRALVAACCGAGLALAWLLMSDNTGQCPHTRQLSPHCQHRCQWPMVTSRSLGGGEEAAGDSRRRAQPRLGTGLRGY